MKNKLSIKELQASSVKCELEITDGYRLELHNQSGWGGYYHSDADYSIEAYGDNFDELIQNILPQYKKGIERDNTDKFILDRYSIYSVRYIKFNGNYFICENDEEEEIELDISVDELTNLLNVACC